MDSEIKVYALTTCVHCKHAKEFLDEKHIPYECVHVDYLTGEERAADTKRLAEALGPQVRTDARLSEIDFGEWEGRRWDDIERKAIDDWAADVLNFTPPGGESVADLQRRVIDFASDLAGAFSGPRVALITHAGVIRALLGHWRQLPVAEWTQLKCDFGSITQIEI